VTPRSAACGEVMARGATSNTGNTCSPKNNTFQLALHGKILRKGRKEDEKHLNRLDPIPTTKKNALQVQDLVVRAYGLATQKKVWWS